MSSQDFMFLKDLHQALRTITTSDKSTIVMGKCLEALEGFLLEKQAELIQQKENSKEE